MVNEKNLVLKVTNQASEEIVDEHVIFDNAAKDPPALSNEKDKPNLVSISFLVEKAFIAEVPTWLPRDEFESFMTSAIHQNAIPNAVVEVIDDWDHKPTFYYYPDSEGGVIGDILRVDLVTTQN